MHGGRVYGRGKYGETLDATGDDGETFAADLEALPGEQPCRVWLGDGKTRHKTTVARLLAAVTAEGHAFVAKRMLPQAAGVARMAFVAEMRSIARINEAYGGAGKVAHFTTLGGMRVGGFADVVGVELHDDRRYIFSRRCDVPLDKHAFGKDADHFVRDLLESFAALHAGGLVHCDVKLDNMIMCGDRFKLIDWGSSERFEQVARRYVGKGNTASPMAWAAWGTGIATPAFYVGYFAVLYGLAPLKCADFVRLASGAYASFRAAYDKEVQRQSRARSDEGFRRGLLRRYVRSIDLFSFGMVLAHVACVFSKRLSRRARARMLELARRLTHYDDPDFTQDAGEALRWYDAQCTTGRTAPGIRMRPGDGGRS